MGIAPCSPCRSWLRTPARRSSAQRDGELPMLHGPDSPGERNTLRKLLLADIALASHRLRCDVLGKGLKGGQPHSPRIHRPRGRNMARIAGTHLLCKQPSSSSPLRLKYQRETLSDLPPNQSLADPPPALQGLPGTETATTPVLCLSRCFSGLQQIGNQGPVPLPGK